MNKVEDRVTRHAASRSLLSVQQCMGQDDQIKPKMSGVMGAAKPTLHPDNNERWRP